MRLNLPILRQAGFFKEYANIPDKELLDTVHEIRRKEYSKIFEYDYEPTKLDDDHVLAMQDTKKFLEIDLEADVCASNNVYTSLLKEFSNASNGYFSPTNIQETWESEEGPIRLHFHSNGNSISFEPEYMDDWIDERVFDLINDEMKKVTDEKFYLCYGPNEEWLGQNAIHVRLTQKEKLLLEEKLDWKFP